MASVWAAEDELLGRLVAVKVLAAGYAQDERANRRFLREARAGARLSDCRHVVTVYDIGEHDGRPFMVMEHFSGGTVADRLRSGREIPRALALRWLREAAEALDCAHRHDVVHRDVKPANLLIDERGRLAVGDFGIATVAAEASLTQTGQVLGTAAYISPEQARGHAATDASDRYALAVVAFELLTGRRPFTADHPAAQARAHVEDSVPSASAAGTGLPAAVDRVLGDGHGQGPRAAPGDRRGLPRRPRGRHRRRGRRPPAADRGHRSRRDGAAAPAHPPGPRRAAPRQGAAGPASPPWPRSRSWPARPSRSPPGPATTAAAAPARPSTPRAPRRTATRRPSRSPRPRRPRRPPRRSRDHPGAGPDHPDAADHDAGARAGAQAKSDDPVALNDQGFALIGQGKPADAVAPLQRSVDGLPRPGAQGRHRLRLRALQPGQRPAPERPPRRRDPVPAGAPAGLQLQARDRPEGARDGQQQAGQSPAARARTSPDRGR